ncbi:GntR family transcriptional regulator [Bacillus tianshenii]|uniref:GntR family transcriptional regulator n=1 Tax=Sutcliffiella tianshenii TaxID=1463404 RepID=UPI00296B4964|nr:GntR family transcriptional regulator [Bacillus tianshenii]
MKALDSSSFVPLYHQLKEILKENILDQKWKPGDKIPSEHQLVEQYKVSRNTAKKAIEDLVNEGILYRVQGTGTFVNKPKIEHSLSGFYSFSQILREKGLNPKDIILELKTESADQTIAKALRLNLDEEVIHLKRVRCANDEPIILESSYLPKKFIHDPDKMKMVGEVPLYDLLANEFETNVVSAKESFEPVLILEKEAIMLGVEKGNPALLLERVAFNGKKEPVEYCKSIVRGDRCRFYTELI